MGILWQGYLEHLGGGGGRKGTELSKLSKGEEDREGRKIQNVLVLRGPCKHKAALSIIFQCHL